MILVDDQAGSCDLFPYIRNITSDAIMTRIDCKFGDIAWCGENEFGPVDVGVEYKQFDDLLTCIGDGRFSGHQLPGLMANYQRIYLLVEMGRIRADRHTGVLMKMKGSQWREVTKAGRGFTMRDLEHWFTTLEEHTQVRVVRTHDEYESARWVTSKHSWWTTKGWDEHKSLKQFHVIAPPAALLTKPSFLRRVAKELPNVEWEKSIAIEAAFPNMLEMANAQEARWREIQGIGKTIAGKIYRAIRGQNP